MIKKAPLEVFQKTIEYFPTVSINLVIQNEKKEFLFVKRKNNPAKGLLWTPGGRVLAGESLEHAAKRLLEEEVGLKGSIEYISNIFQEEIYDTKDFDVEDKKIYPAEVHHVHYLVTSAYIRIDSRAIIKLDFQSMDYKWLKEIPNNHIYLNKFFELVREYIKN